MQPFSTKELYMMNGGNKIYIYKDGFGDVYDATPEEEAEWAQEIIDRALVKIDTEENANSIRLAIDNLRFHNYPDLDTLLESKLQGASLVRQDAFAIALWKIKKYENSFEIIRLNLALHNDLGLSNVFYSLDDFKNNMAARRFIVACLVSDDEVLFAKAQITLGMWAYSGMPALRYDNLLERLQPVDRQLPAFKRAIEQLKTVLEIDI